MRSLFDLMLERWAHRVALTTAVGVTAGIRAAMTDDDTVPIESRVTAELGAVIGELANPPPLLGDQRLLTPGVPPKRGVGRPRKGTGPEGDQ